MSRYVTERQKLLEALDEIESDADAGAHEYVRDAPTADIEMIRQFILDHTSGNSGVFEQEQPVCTGVPGYHHFELQIQPANTDGQESSITLYGVKER